MKRKMKYLALYALPDISEAKEDLEICHDDITQDKAQEILIYSEAQSRKAHGEDIIYPVESEA